MERKRTTKCRCTIQWIYVDLISENKTAKQEEEAKGAEGEEKVEV